MYFSPGFDSDFLGTSQETDASEKHRQYDLFHVEWDVKP